MSLTKSQRAEIERRLKEERTSALQLLGRESADLASDTDPDDSGDLSRMPTHMADLGTDTMDAELDASNAGRISVELAEIDAALERLYKSPETFGTCERTGEPIPFERLKVIPWARTRT
jgi:DnaK suppressor protein